ncbi:MAG: SDR family oxidoreductase [Anaerofustis stercorihominis]|nr:SDR family oxidoreductase [Anaerofustis stercorihominis]
MRLKDKVIFVTAATRGIGLATVKACAKEGAKVYMGARSVSHAEKEISELRAMGYDVAAVYNDATVTDTFITAIDQIVKDNGRIDVLVNNFGTSDPGKDMNLSATDDEIFIRTVKANLMSVYSSSRYASEYMKKQGGGSIVNISSIGGSVPDISQIGYGVSKAAINYLTKLIAVHEAKNNIRCNAVLPGMTATDSVKDKLSDEFRKLFMRHIPLGRMATAEEIASAVVYFASDESAYTTGQLLSIDGGFGLATPVYADLSSSETGR